MAHIDRGKLLKDISESVIFSGRSGIPSAEVRGANKVIDRIKSAPAADVVEVVRCRNCIWYKPLNVNDGYGICKKVTYHAEKRIHTRATGYCDCGERRETDA